MFARLHRKRFLPLAATCLIALAVGCTERPTAAGRKSAAPAAPVPERTPARVMPFGGSDWLERPGREAQEKPEEVLRAMRLRPGDVVAEIGAGTGYFARRIATRVVPGGRVYAVDIQPEMLAELRRFAERHGVAGTITTILGAEADPRLPAHAMDWVLLVDVYHEFQQPKPMLAKIRQSLKPNGRVALVEYRLEGDTADYVNLAHRMSVEQVLAEWLPAGFELVERRETLPSQHLFIFRARRSAR